MTSQKRLMDFLTQYLLEISICTQIIIDVIAKYMFQNFYPLFQSSKKYKNTYHQSNLIPMIELLSQYYYYYYYIQSLIYSIIFKYIEKTQNTMNQQPNKPPNIKKQTPMIKKTTTHSFSVKPSKAQILAYSIISTQVIIYYLCVYPLYESLTLITIFSLTFMMVIASTLLTSLTDPTDKVVYAFRSRKLQIQNQENNDANNQQVKMQQFSLLYYCQNCDSKVSLSSKHCRCCDRCVNGFDHHCIWVNNCIGTSNYQYFISMILSVFLQIMVFLINSSIAISLRSFIGWRNILMVIEMVVISIFQIMLLGLIILHFYLIWTNQTTFQFLTKSKKIQQHTNAPIGFTNNQQNNKQTSNAMLKVSAKQFQDKIAKSTNKINIVKKNQQRQDQMNSQIKDNIFSRHQQAVSVKIQSDNGSVVPIGDGEILHQSFIRKSLKLILGQKSVQVCKSKR